MVLTKEDPQAKGHAHYHGINHVMVADGEEGIFSAFVEFAFRHTQNDNDVYEHAARHTIHKDQKILFLQLSFRKKEILYKLKMQRSDAEVLRSSGKSRNGHPLSWYLKELDPEALITVEDALKFAIQRECGTFMLYKKLEKIAVLDSTKALFEFLVKSQYALMEFLSSQHSAAIAEQAALFTHSKEGPYAK